MMAGGGGYCRHYVRIELPKRRNIHKSSCLSPSYSISQTFLLLGGSLGLAVMGGDSCSKGYELESRQRSLDGHFYIFCCKNCDVCLNRQK